MDNWVWIFLMIIALLFCVVMSMYVYSLNRRLEYYRRTLIAITTGPLMAESISIVASGYGLTDDELMTIIETYQNTTGKRK